MKITTIEEKKLKQMESIVEDGLRGFIAVGVALRTISDEKLYRDNYDTFDKYLRDRWKLGKNYAYKLMQGAEVATRIEGVENECQARELAKVPFTDQQKVMDRAKEHAVLEGRAVVARDIKEAATEPSSMTARETVDEVWAEENLSELWNMAFEIVDELKEVSRKLAAHPQGCWLQSHADTTEVRIRDIKNVLEHSKPSGPCPMCMGGLQAKCETCRSRGWLPSGRLKAVNKKLQQNKED